MGGWMLMTQTLQDRTQKETRCVHKNDLVLWFRMEKELFSFSMYWNYGAFVVLFLLRFRCSVFILNVVCSNTMYSVGAVSSQQHDLFPPYQQPKTTAMTEKARNR